MVMTTNFNSLTACLSSFGIDKNFLHRIILPDWWTEDVLSSKAGYMQTLSIIAKNLNLNLSDLLTNPDKFNLINQYPIKFKKAANVNISHEDLWPNVIASRIANLIEETFLLPPQKPGEDIFKLRNDFLQKFDKIELSSVLDFLWTMGIPVIYISQFPRDVHKMDGMVVKSGDRFIIFISKNRRHNAWGFIHNPT